MISLVAHQSTHQFIVKSMAVDLEIRVDTLRLRRSKGYLPPNKFYPGYKLIRACPGLKTTILT